MKIVFATNNKNKLQEIRQALGDEFEVLGLKDIDFSGELPETKETLEGNAIQKARVIHDRFDLPVFSDDTGLEVRALNGRPGVYSARYAGAQCSAEDNISKLLYEMDGVEDRRARFRTVIAFLSEGSEKLFKGEVRGEILPDRQGEKGFGYDPVFRPEGFQSSFAEMKMDEKNKISHRGKAIRKLADYLRQNL